MEISISKTQTLKIAKQSSALNIQMNNLKIKAEELEELEEKTVTMYEMKCLRRVRRERGHNV